MAENFGHEDEGDSASSSPYADPEDSELVAKAKEHVEPPFVYSYTERDVVLYNLGVGATEKEMQWKFEGEDELSEMKKLGVIKKLQAN